MFLLLYWVLDVGMIVFGVVCDVEIGEFSVVDNFVLIVNNFVEMFEFSVVDNFVNNFVSVDVDLEDNVNVFILDEIGLEVNVNVVNGDLYFVWMVGLWELFRSFFVYNNVVNEFFDCFRFVFFILLRFILVCFVFDVLCLVEIEF